MIGKHIHTRIFLLVLLVILFLTLGAGLTFSVSSSWYVQYAAERDASAIIDIVKNDSADIREYSPEKARAYSKDLLQKVKETIKTEAFNGILLIFNFKYDLVYPEAFQNNEISDLLTSACSSAIKQEAGESVHSRIIQAERQKWYLKFFTLKTDYSVRAKYFIAAVPIPDMSAFWNYTQKRFWIVLLTASGISSVLAWLISRSISMPLQKLCRRIQILGDGYLNPIDENFSLSELESLKLSYNQMEQRIQKSEEEKNRFFQNVSHDLKTPLASITGYAQGISCGVIEDHKKAAEIILSESLRMTSLIESILSLTKMDNQNLHLHLTDVDLVEFTDECMESMQGINMDCSLILITDPDVICIETDPDLLNRILQNLLSNSLRYADTKITVDITQKEHMAIILIKDDGPGFDNADLPHVFERFYKGKGGKTGIGLSVVWSAIHYLGGSIEIGNQSHPSKGAYYRLYLPEKFHISQKQGLPHS